MDIALGEAVDGRDKLLEMINAAWMCQAIGAACELGIIDRLAAGISDGFALSRELGLAAEAVRRLLRALAALGIVAEGSAGFSLTARGNLLVADAEGSLRHWALMASSRGWAAWTHLRSGIRTGCNVRTSAGLTSLRDLDGEDAERFNHAMMDLTRPVARALAARIAFDGTETLVDVGGGAGHLLMPLLERYPAMRGVVFDLPHARGLARQVIDGARLARRCRFVAGSFLDAVPGNGDVYLLKSVLHNWSDDRALDILRRCRGAMREGARMLVIERVLPVTIADTPIDRENSRSDLQMLLACDGRERTAGEFAQLLGEANLRMETITALTPLVSAIEAHA